MFTGRGRCMTRWVHTRHRGFSVNWCHADRMRNIAKAAVMCGMPK